MKIAFLFGGQGSQEVSMGYDFYKNEKIAKDFYDSINIEKDVLKLSFFSDENTIRKTENTQVILVSYQAMVSDLLIKNNIIPDALSGLSIGEYSALYTSGVINKEDLLSIANFRGEEMKKSSEEITPLMYAVMGLSEEEINSICKKNSRDKKRVSISNINTKNQIVISGEEKAVENSVLDLKEKGARVIKLNVSGAFHTDYMNDASKKLEEYFKNINFNEEKIPVYYNLLGDKKDSEDIKEIMVKQVSNTVRFKEDLENMIKDGIDTFVEIGYFNILKGFVKKINRNVEIYSISDYESYLNFLKEMKNGK